MKPKFLFELNLFKQSYGLFISKVKICQVKWQIAKKIINTDKNETLSERIDTDKKIKTKGA